MCVFLFGVFTFATGLRVAPPAYYLEPRESYEPELLSVSLISI